MGGLQWIQRVLRTLVSCNSNRGHCPLRLRRDNNRPVRTRLYLTMVVEGWMACTSGFGRNSNERLVGLSGMAICVKRSWTGLASLRGREEGEVRHSTRLSSLREERGISSDQKSRKNPNKGVQRQQFCLRPTNKVLPGSDIVSPSVKFCGCFNFICTHRNCPTKIILMSNLYFRF